MRKTTTTTSAKRRWRAQVTSAATGRGLIRVQVKGANCDEAERNAIAVAALNLRMGPQELKVWKLAEIQLDWAREEVCA